MSGRVTRSGKDGDGDIICFSGYLRSVSKSDGVSLITRYSGAFLVNVGGRRVSVRVGSRNGQDYMTTAADGYPPNNLDGLPGC